MRYRLFLYAASEMSADAPAIHEINYVICDKNHRPQYDLSEFLHPFDAAAVLRSIEAELTDASTGQCLCRAVCKTVPAKGGGAGYIAVTSSYDMAAKVLPRVRMIAEEYGLVLYDAEQDKAYYQSAEDGPFIAMRRRQMQLKQAILSELQPVWSCRKLTENSLVITLKKDPARSFEERNAQFYRLLQDRLQPGRR